MLLTSIIVTKAKLITTLRQAISSGFETNKEKMMITVIGKRTTLDLLRGIEPVTPENAGRRWKPVQHGELVDTIKDEIALRGWVVEEELFATAHEEATMVGAFLLGNVQDVPDVPMGMQLALGFVNDNDRRKALRLTVGASVLCCANGLCTGSIVLNRVHDHTVDLIDEIEDAIGRYAIEAAGVTNVVRGLRERELSPAEASEVLMQAGRARLVGWTAIGRVDAEYRHPTFVEHGLNNSWALLNAFTYTARRNITPTCQMEAYDAFRKLLPVVASN
jgi:hypothetical protein